MFELRPTRRKAAALERVRATAEAVFWSVIGQNRDPADAVANQSDAKARRTARRTLEAEIGQHVIAAGAKSGLAEPVVQGLIRDAVMAIGSYIELRAGGHAAEWPTPAQATRPDHADALDQFLDATTLDHEKAARDALALVLRQPGPRPLVLARVRDGMLVRLGPNEDIAAVLNVLRASDPKSRPATIRPGVEAATGKAIPGGTSKTKLVIPVACSKWHEQKFLSGRTTLRSSLIVRRADRWFMCAQFEMPEARVRLTGARLGVDRGVVNPVATAIVSQAGAVLAASEPLGAEIGTTIRRADERRRAEQQRRNVTSRRHAGRVDDALHRLANGIVAGARSHGAQVVLENLEGLKQNITTPRPKGARKGGWRRVLKRAQLGKLETILAYKLALAGLPPPRGVVAGGTSQTCPACGVRDPKNRTTQDRFSCVACGFAAHADRVGAVNIARRGVAMDGIKRGDKLAPREQDMVARLRLRDDSGLGPLAAGLMAADGFVAVRASAAEVAGPVPLTLDAGQKTESGIQNVRKRVFAERDAAESDGLKAAIVLTDQGVRQ